ncbi:MAG TPA: glycoside hydrolase family 36 protein [Terriglobales bacterium]|nr:glycoside hydrolase family 36 protein [Terriglobales bacterium]
MDRREFLRVSSGAAAGCMLLPPALEAALAPGFGAAFRADQGKVVPLDAAANVDKIVLVRRWRGDVLTSQVVNRSKQPVRIREIVLASAQHGMPAEARLYGESFQMLSQTSGTLARPEDMGYSERKHYRIPQPEDATSIFSLLMLTPPGGKTTMAAFTSCRRFIGRFYLRPQTLDTVIDTEGLELNPGQSWELEEFMLGEGAGRAGLLGQLSARLVQNHPRKPFTPIPTGWCSWYHFGPRVTAKNVLDNLEYIAENIPGLRYIQIDDGYQAAMGDWLETGKAFGGDVVSVLKEIRKRGFEPAIWVAPFIAQKDSHVFQQHPEWFIMDVDGNPLASNTVTFGGWRFGPWYALDGTHPEVQKHFEEFFGQMRRDWGCTYFKLDANFWGAMHGGRFHDPRATRVEAYRRGMQAIQRGVGDGFILGCNHPMWPSLGLIDGSRSSDDIKRTWAKFRGAGRQNLARGWQNGKLWWNDPDAVVLTGEMSDDEYQLHATVIYACGGMTLNGDDLTTISPARLEMLRKLLPPTGVAAEFEDDSLRVGYIRLPKALMVCLFNWEETPQTLSFRLPAGGRRVSDYWSEEDMGRRDGVVEVKDMPPHSARLFKCV